MSTVAARIRAEKVSCPDHPMPLPKPSCWTCGRNGAFERAARIVEGYAGNVEANACGCDGTPHRVGQRRACRPAEISGSTLCIQQPCEWYTSDPSGICTGCRRDLSQTSADVDAVPHPSLSAPTAQTGSTS